MSMVGRHSKERWSPPSPIQEPNAVSPPRLMDVIHRRRLIVLAGVTMAGAAGCLDDDPEEPADTEEDAPEAEPEDDDADAGEPEDDVEGIDPEDLPEGEDQLVYGDLEILEHKMVVQEDDFGIENIEVEGLVENRGDEYDYVEVWVRIYNEDGHHLDSYLDNTSNLSADGTWAFNIMIFGYDAEEIAAYDIAVSGSRYRY